MATSNTLTGLIPNLYAGLNIVSREMVGFIPAVSRDSTAERAALNQTVRSPIGVSGALEDVTPGQQPANSGGTTTTYVDVTISKSKAAPILWSGEEQLSIGATGQLGKIQIDQFADGMRKLVNAMEIDLAICAKQNASRAYGTAGTTPLGTAGDLSDIAQVRKILEDNGAPISDLQMVFNSAAMANLRGKQSVLFKVNEAGTDRMLRDGIADRLEGFAIRNSAGLTLHTKGTGSGYLINNAAGAVGDTTILADTGTGTILAGDIASVAGDSNKYVVNAAYASTSFGIGKPGALTAFADNAAITIGNSYAPNIGFARQALVLACRAPALPDGGDSADDRTTITDPITGLTFEVSLYRQYRQQKIEIAMAWGVGAPNSAHIATLLG